MFRIILFNFNDTEHLSSTWVRLQYNQMLDQHHQFWWWESGNMKQYMIKSFITGSLCFSSVFVSQTLNVNDVTLVGYLWKPFFTYSLCSCANILMSWLHREFPDICSLCVIVLCCLRLCVVSFLQSFMWEAGKSGVQVFEVAD